MHPDACEASQDKRRAQEGRKKIDGFKISLFCNLLLPSVANLVDATYGRCFARSAKFATEGSRVDRR